MASTLNSLRILADPVRARLLRLLRQGELTVAEVQEILQMGQSRISTHLGQLKRANLVQDRRVGKNIFYSLHPSPSIPAFELGRMLDLATDELPETRTDEAGYEHVLARRHDRSREYFNRLAGKFGRSHCPGRSWQALAHALLTLLPGIDVADLGAGEGTLSQLLARQVRRVIAVDLSEKMVEFGANTARANGFQNLEYRLGDIENPPIDPGSVDLAIFSQALHHAVDPFRAVEAAYRILRRTGKVLILDLLAHDYEQARDLYADRWLGFSEIELVRWLSQAGFHSAQAGIVARERESPFFQTVLATATK